MNGEPLARLNAAGVDEAVARLLDACHSRRWVEAMAAARPFASLDALRAASERAFDALGEADWLEAFAAHPRIGAQPGAGGIGAAVGFVATEPSPAALPRQPGAAPGTQPGQAPGAPPGSGGPSTQPGPGTPGAQPGTTR